MTKVPGVRRAIAADARVRFTREVLGDALVALMHEWPFEQFTVQNILDRAGVGRTTFYTHYTDKQDLFLDPSPDVWVRSLSRAAFSDPISRILRSGSQILDWAGA